MGSHFDLPASVSGHVDAVERRAAEALFADHGRLIVGQYIEFQQLFGRGRNLENDLSESFYNDLLANADIVYADTDTAADSESE